MSWRDADTLLVPPYTETFLSRKEIKHHITTNKYVLLLLLIIIVIISPLSSVSTYCSSASVVVQSWALMTEVKFGGVVQSWRGNHQLRSHPFFFPLFNHSSLQLSAPTASRAVLLLTFPPPTLWLVAAIEGSYFSIVIFHGIYQRKSYKIHDVQEKNK